MEQSVNILKRFNVSYSTWSCYKQSQLQCYFDKIAQIEKTDNGTPVYGDAGNVIHNSAEDYIKLGENTFEKNWIQYDIDNQTGIRGAKLSKENYLDMYNKVIGIIDDWNMPEQEVDLYAEENFNFEFHGMKIKGQIDLVITCGKTDEIILIDWKTNSANNYELHKDQRLFYSWAIWKTRGIIPSTKWIYLKDYDGEKGIHRDEFTETDLEKFEIKLKEFINEIEEKGYDIKKYLPGDYKNPFNQYYTACIEEVRNRINEENQKITLEIKGHFVFIKGMLDHILEEGIDRVTKFDLKNKYYMQKIAKERDENIAEYKLEDIGTYHLYVKKFKCFPIGLLPTIKKIIQEYFDYYKKSGKIEIIDHRDKSVMNQMLGNFRNIAFYSARLRDYQKEAVEKFLEKNFGIIQIATGGGKTFTAGELIKNIDGKTLWICDRKELLKQTKDSLEEQLGMEIGIISGSDFKICDITIATIQSLKSKLKQIQDYLYTINFVIVDEFHKAAAESYQTVFAKLPNTKHRLGLTATPTRDDGKEPILKSILGDVIYRITSEDLINQGYLVKPQIKFIKIVGETKKYVGYGKTKEVLKDGSIINHEGEYDENIVFNEERNEKIIDIVINTESEKKILILTKSVDHGDQLNIKLQQLGQDCLHIFGGTDKKLREQSYKNFVESQFKILILTISIGAEGLDIPDLDVIINAAANKGDVKSIQILGRVLRISEGKSSAIYYDFLDSGKWTKKHSLARIKAFKAEGYDVSIIN